MKLDHTSVRAGCVTFCGNKSNGADPSETIIVIRTPHLTPREEDMVRDMIVPIVSNMAQLFEEDAAKTTLGKG